MAQCPKCHPKGDGIKCRCIDGCHCPDKLNSPMPPIKPITVEKILYKAFIEIHDIVQKTLKSIVEMRKEDF